MTPATSLFYYAVSVKQDTFAASTVAPALTTLPLLGDLKAAVLIEPDGPNAPAGLYVKDGVRWRYALPYQDFCFSIIRGDALTVYLNKTVDEQAPANSDLYINGQPIAGLSVEAGSFVYAARTPPAGGGGGGSYVLPAATATVLGGVMVPASSNLTVNGAGAIDLKASVLTTINAKVNSVADAAGATGTSLVVSPGPDATLKTISASSRMTVTDQGTNLQLDVPIATASVLGLVKAGSGVAIAADGTLSATSGVLTLTGDVSGSGTGSIPTVLSTTGVVAGTYTKVTVDSKGRVSLGASLSNTDVNTALGYTAYDGAANPSGFLTANQTITVTGDASATGTNALTLTLVNSGVVAGTYTKVTVDAKGRVTAGTSPSTLAGLGITDAVSNTGGSVTGNLVFGSGATVTGVPDPVNPLDVVNKQSLDLAVASVASGTKWKDNADVTTTADIALTGTPVIDGYQTVVNDRVLVKNQTDAKQNGVYVVAAGAWTRSADANTSAEIEGMAILVINGTVHALSQWVNTNGAPPVLGTDNINFAMLQGNGTTYTAGTGLTLTGTEFSITNTGVVAGTYTKVTVNAQGQVTTGASLNATDVNTALGYTAYNGATNPSGFLTANQAITVSGDATATGTTALNLVLAASGVTAGTYTKVTVDAKGRVTVGANLALADVTTALGFTPVNKAGDTMNGALNWATTVSLASAATTDIGGAASNSILITGTVTITALGVAPAGAERWATFADALTLTHNATSLILPTGANIAVVAGDSANFMSLGGGNWRCISYTRADGTALAGGAASDPTKLPLAGGSLTGALNLAPAVTVTAAATTNIGAANSNSVTINGATTITAFDTITDGARRYVTFAGALTLTHNAASLILPTGANIVTATGDTAEFVSLGAGNWKCLSYNKAAGTALKGDSTNAALTNPTVTDYVEAGVAQAAGTAFTINLAQGTDQDVTTNGNATVTLPAVVVGKSFTLTVNYGGTHTLAFAGGTVRWANNTVPTPTSINGKADRYVFQANRAGTAWFGADAGRNF